jgi:hypothetical protein
MFLGLSTEWTFMIFVTIVGAAYFLAYCMEGVLGKGGFGTSGNLAIIATGSYLGIYIAKMYRFDVFNPTISVYAALVGAFVALFGLCIAKTALSRL